MSTEVAEATPQEIVAAASPEQIQPNPVLWPQCPDCQMPYDLRRALRFGADGVAETWAWFRPKPVPKGCKHKGDAVMMTAAGEYVRDESGDA